MLTVNDRQQIEIILQKKSYSKNTYNNEKEGAKTANDGVDRVQAGGRLRNELDLEHRFPLFHGVSSFGNVCE